LTIPTESTTTAVSPRTPFATRMANALGDQFAFMVPEPETIRDRGPVMAPLVFILLVNFVSATAMQPAITAALQASQPAGAANVSFWLWLTALFAPVLTLLKALILTAVAWSVITLIGNEARFRTLLSLNVYGQAILALSPLFTVIVLHIRGLEAITSPDALLVSQGIDLFIDERSSPILLGLAQQGTIFHAGWFAFTAWCLRRATRLSLGTSLVVTTILWCGGLLVSILRSTMIV